MNESAEYERLEATGEIRRVRYPDVTVRLSGRDGNAAMIIAAVRRALGRAGVSQAEINTFTSQATVGDYDNVIQTAMQWVEVE
jgi:hypothetical protein